MISQKEELTWLERLDGAQTTVDLVSTVRQWMAWTRMSGYPQGSLGFEVYMRSNDWQSAKGSLIRSFGRDPGGHQHLLEFLTAAIDRKRFLVARDA